VPHEDDNYLSRRVNRRQAFLSQTVTLDTNLQTTLIEFPGAVQPGQVTVQIQDPTAAAARRSAQVSVRSFRERSQGVYFTRIASTSNITAPATNRRGGFTLPFSGGLQLEAQRGSAVVTVLDIWIDFNDTPYGSVNVPPISTQITIGAGAGADAGPPPPSTETVQIFGDRTNLTGAWADDAGVVVATLTGPDLARPIIAASGFHLQLANGGGAALDTLVVWT
jgi:hypothetical protein